MQNRIEKKFRDLKRDDKKAFIAFMTAGDPNLTTTQRLVLAFEKAGVDIIELGVPFSDPMADGPTIQTASYRALQKGITLNKILNAVVRIRKISQIPIVLMTYYNPVFHFGEERFVVKAKQKGVDGVIIPDLPPEEAGVLMEAAKKNNFATVFFLSPTTTKKRMKKIIPAATGFIYYVSLTGTTGERPNLPKDVMPHVRMAKRLTDKPICVGFGVSTPRQVRTVTKFADGVIVGSAIVKEIHKNAGKNNLVDNVAKFVLQSSRSVR